MPGRRKKTRLDKALARLQVRRLTALALVFLFSLGGGWGIARYLDMRGLPTNDWLSDKPAQGSEKISLPQRINVLLVGSDYRPGEGRGRSDTIIVASLDRASGRMAVLSVPRDTRVNIPQHGIEKINAAYAYGGVELTQQVVEELLGIKIPYYVETNFNGFVDIIDTLGGVTLDVERSMNYPEENIDLKPGLQRLGGEDALGYVRFRNYTDGDIDRTEHQQKFLVALANEVLQVKTLAKLPQLIPQLYKNVETNLALSQGLELASVAAKLDPSKISTATLPGNFLDIPGASYWAVDPKKAKGMLDSLLLEPQPSVEQGAKG